MSNKDETARCLILAAVVAISFVLGGIMAIDALEFETTGQCRDCVLLPFINGSVK